MEAMKFKQMLTPSARHPIVAPFVPLRFALRPSFFMQIQRQMARMMFAQFRFNLAHRVPFWRHRVAIALQIRLQ
jgi:hypothetical protein